MEKKNGKLLGYLARLGELTALLERGHWGLKLLVYEALSY